MLTAETKRRLDACRDILVGKLPLPTDQIELITLTLIYKFMDDLDEESVKLGGRRSFFVGPLEKYRWRALLPQTVSADERMNLFAEGIEAIGKAEHLPALFRDIFRNSFLKFRDGRILTLFLNEVNDCEDILNVVLARPIMSPTDFIQIKGRGTRLFTFKHQDGENEQKIDKDGFGLFDFFANCEYFEEDFDYDQRLIPPREPVPPGPKGGGGGGGIRADTLTSTSPDPLRTVADHEIGQWGMRIDREMYRDRFAHQANEAVASDAILRDAFDAEDWPAVEERIRRLLFEKPEEFWDLPKLQQVYKTDRAPSLREILGKIFGVIPSIPTREQLADEAYQRFVATQNTNAVHSRELRTVFVAFLLDPISRQLLEHGRFPDLRARDPNLHAALSALPAGERDALVHYLKAEVSLKDFERAA